jgi:hypothetical protein
MRTELAQQRGLLARANAVTPQSEIESALRDVDAALDRVAHGTYGICDVCHEEIEAERLEHDPLALSCGIHPSPAELARLQRDLSLARRVQRGLLPEPHGFLQGWEYRYLYEAAGDVGGDFCDVLRCRRAADTRRRRRRLQERRRRVAAHGQQLRRRSGLAIIGLPAGGLLARVNELFHVRPHRRHARRWPRQRFDRMGSRSLQCRPQRRCRRGRGIETLSVRSDCRSGSQGFALRPTPIALAPADTLSSTRMAPSTRRTAPARISRRQLADGAADTDSGLHALVDPACWTCGASGTAGRP